MKQLLTLFLALASTGIAAALSAASVDGQWTGELKMPADKRAAASTEPRKLEFTMDLKSQGDVLTGSVKAMNPRGKGRDAAIQEGKLTGDSFRFVTVQKAKGGENKIVWSGSVKGDEITGTRGREGAKRTPEFTAKRK